MTETEKITTTTLPDEDEPPDDERRWLTPDEEAGVVETDPWTVVLDDRAEELEHPFPYPTGMP